MAKAPSFPPRRLPSCWRRTASISMAKALPSRLTAMSCGGRIGRTPNSRPETTWRSSGCGKADEKMKDAMNKNDPLVIAGRTFHSRLFLGTAGYPNRQVMLDAVAASGAELVTASVRRISLAGEEETLLDLLAGKVHFLPNTAGCQTAKDAVLTAELAREALQTNWVKLEVIGDRELLYPNVEELLAAAGELIAHGFVVLPYCND